MVSLVLNTLEFLFISKWKGTIVIWKHKSGPQKSSYLEIFDLRIITAHIDKADKWNHQSK